MFEGYDRRERDGEGLDRLSFRAGRELSPDELREVYQKVAESKDDLRAFLREALSSGVNDNSKLDSLFASVWNVAKDRAIKESITKFLKDAFEGNESIVELKNNAISTFPQTIRELAREFREEALLSELPEETANYFIVRGVEDRVGLEASFLREIRAASRLAETQMRRMGY